MSKFDRIRTLDRLLYIYHHTKQYNYETSKFLDINQKTKR